MVRKFIHKRNIKFLAEMTKFKSFKKDIISVQNDAVLAIISWTISW